MSKTPVVFRHPDDDPLKDRRAIDDVSKRRKVMLLVGSVLVCGFLCGGVSSAAVLAMANANDADTTTVEPLPTLALLPSATMVVAAEVTAEVTEAVESTEVVESTVEVTEQVLSEAAMTATAWYVATDIPPGVDDNPYTVSGGPSSGVVGGGGVRVVTVQPQVIVRTVVSPVVVTRETKILVPVVITATYTHTPAITPTVTPTITETPTVTFTPTWTQTPTATWTATLEPTLEPTFTDVPTEIVWPTDIPTEVVWPTELPELEYPFPHPELTVEPAFIEVVEGQA